MAGNGEVIAAVRAIRDGGSFDVVEAIRLLARLTVLLADDESELGAAGPADTGYTGDDETEMAVAVVKGKKK